MRGALVCSLLLSGCQCLAPVDERFDAGVPQVDAGRTDAGLGDAGLDDAGSADAGAQCALASDCGPSDGGLPFCTGAAMSCISGQCVLECQGGRECAPATQPTCLLCTPGAPPPPQCPGCNNGLRGCAFQVESPDCAGTRFALDTRWRLDAVDGGCSTFELVPQDGGRSAGTWYAPNSNGQGQATLPELGGQCTLQSPATGAPRLVVQCPRCSFVEIGCE